MRAILSGGFALVLATAAAQAPPPANHSVDPEHLFVAKPVASPVTTVTEPVAGSDIPVQITYVETRDGLYTPVGIRKPAGPGPFPTIVFAHMNGGMGVRWIREWTQNGSWTLEQFLGAGYAVAWMRYRAEVDNAYGPTLVERAREGRQLFNRGPFEYEDAVDVIEYVKTLPFVDRDRVGYVGLSHGGEMLMKIASEYHGLRAGIASEPASMEYLARRPQPRNPNAPRAPETLEVNTEEMQREATVEMRRRIDLDAAMSRIKAIDTPIFIQGRDRDHNQAVFRLNYELLKEAGKDVEWKSYDHGEHGFVFVRRNARGVYAPDPIQTRVVEDSIAYFDRRMKPVGRQVATGLLDNPRYAEGARSRLDQFVRRGADPKEAEAIFRKLTSLDAEPWVSEWSRLAEPWERRAAVFEAQGQTTEAREAYLKASMYYSIAKFPVINHPAKQAAYRKSIDLYLKAARWFDPPLERVTIPFEGRQIIGYLRIPNGATRPPVVIATGGIDVYKEDRDVSDILGLGFASFSMDMPGAGESPVWYSPDAHRIYSATIDYLQTRRDLDGARIGIIGRSYGGYWGARVAYAEPARVKAAVQWGGPIHYTFQQPWIEHLETERLYLWSLLDSMIYAHHVKDLDELRRYAPTLSMKAQGLLDTPSAPLLAINGKQDPWISIDDLYILLEGGAAKSARVLAKGGHMGRGEPGADKVVTEWLRAQLDRPALRGTVTLSTSEREESVAVPVKSVTVPLVTVAMFGGETPPLFAVAQANGLFEKFGVRVAVEPRWTSEELREGLAEGRFNVVHSLADNAVAVAEDLKVPTVILMGSGSGGSGGVDLVTQPEIEAVAQLKGTTILVDSPDTGHALALRKILRLNGLESGRDYTMLPFGQTQKRFEAMKGNKQYAATMAPYTDEARRLGFNSVARAADVVGRYQVSAVYARRDWVTANPEAAVGYLAGYLHASRWVRDPENRRAVMDALAKRSTPEAAAQAYARLTSGSADAEPTLDLEAFGNGLALRAEIQGTWGGKPPAPERYYDLAYAKKALARLKSGPNQ
jgi:esterase FrsA